MEGRASEAATLAVRYPSRLLNHRAQRLRDLAPNCRDASRGATAEEPQGSELYGSRVCCYDWWWGLSELQSS